MIDMAIDMTALDQRITFYDVKEQGMSSFFQDAGQILVDSILKGLDEGGSPMPFQPTKIPTGRPPLGGSGGSIGRSIHISLVDEHSVTVTASGLPYNVIHQLGGTIPPVEGKLMVFQSAGKPVFTMRHKEIQIPSRRYMRFYDDAVSRIKQLFLEYFTK